MSNSLPSASAIRVLLVDDNAMFRQGLRHALADYPNLEVVGEAGDGAEALSCVAGLNPTIVVMDINLPKLDGIAATGLIKRQYPQIAVIGLSVEQKDYMLYAMQKAGAFEVIQKETAMLQIYSAIQRAVAAVQPVLVMDEPSLPKQTAVEKVESSDTTELTSTTRPVERPQPGQEEEFDQS